MPLLVFGHKNPDTDSVTSAIALSKLKNMLGEDTVPCILGNLTEEAKFVLDYFQVSVPELIKNVKIQLKDLNYDRVEGISPSASILHAYKLMEERNLKTLPIVDEDERLAGIVTMKDIAMGLIKGDFYTLETSLENLAADLNGEILVKACEEIKGRIKIMAFYDDTILGTLSQKDVIIVGDRYRIIENAIEVGVQLILVTGGKTLPEKYVQMAAEKKVNLLAVSIDTFMTSKLINQCNFIASIMKRQGIIQFQEEEYLEEVKDEMIHTTFRNFPVIDRDQKFLGFIGRRHIINPQKKKVILVDHNEYAQSAEGLAEAEIIEIVDHHKIGDISTSIPISFRNMPVGSTCTIVYYLFMEAGKEIPRKIAGLLLSGIVSDTLLLRSPTTTLWDRNVITALNKILNLDLESYAMEMFKAGTSLEGYSIEEVFYKDFKEFQLEGVKIGISQVFTLDIEDVFNRKDQFTDFIQRVHGHNSYYLTLLVITDILSEGSYLLYQCANESLLAVAFDIEPQQGVFVQAIVSRKKQILPKLADALRMLK
ncbi:putative manganese-dependent inorganic diphosphatase [Geosporobacter ferrireducens]|uniref:inorganic diphosphatase n=1 Tax=Geosporobacter ferrireducens TaxID=1424294 RepID=A0A1D8GJF2_9FIRM|nr:putative manganese-dependent inorganic diphosphatase [Geosporobacter ferrireducens]AOT71046.1 inorganic pyrophosphatase [Geosporobacter ferrireducens]MTI58269.1 putative manganese-dependent inorganic diphosphatase [Geosporobacter ferrireducens]